MNKTLKRAAVACLVMFALLMINVNILQAVRAEELSGDSATPATTTRGTPSSGDASSRAAR